MLRPRRRRRARRLEAHGSSRLFRARHWPAPEKRTGGLLGRRALTRWSPRGGGTARRRLFLDYRRWPSPSTGGVSDADDFVLHTIVHARSFRAGNDAQRLIATIEHGEMATIAASRDRWLASARPPRQRAGAVSRRVSSAKTRADRLRLSAIVTTAAASPGRPAAVKPLPVSISSPSLAVRGQGAAPARRRPGRRLPLASYLPYEAAVARPTMAGARRYANAAWSARCARDSPFRRGSRQCHGSAVDHDKYQVSDVSRQTKAPQKATDTAA